MADTEDDEIINEFVTESFELLDDLDRQFVALEADPSSRERLAAIFRVIHTIKGTSGLLGYGRLEKVTHNAENVLAKLRDGQLQLTPETTSALLKSADAAREMLGRIAQTRAEGESDYAELLEELKASLEARQKPAPLPVPPPSHVLLLPSLPAGLAQAPGAGSANAPAVSALPGGARSAAAQASSSLRGVSSSPRAGSLAPPSAQRATAFRESEAPRDGNIRVGVGALDRLMNLVGELVLARNQVLQGCARSTDPALTASAQRLNLITTELQEGIMKTRMQAIGSVWTKFPRIVRDLAMVCGKQVRLELVGADTDLDRSVIEAIRDPLTHLVRNSVDHGIETPDVRVKAGKAATGVIIFRAFHEGGMVNIEVSDDGGGVDLERVRAKAVERNLLSADRASSLSDREALQLLFLPGFSTAKQVTNVSGRGVGMDVVKTSIEKIGGAVELQSKQGEGTIIRVKIPLTLAIIPALIVSCAGQRYAIPQVNLVELIRVEAKALEYAREAPVYRLRGELLPLVFLRRVFAGPSPTTPPKAYQVIVLRADDKTFGLVVDDIDDTQEIVVKPLGRELKGIPAFAGATILGDGRIALILDVFGIAVTAGMNVDAVEAAPPAPVVEVEGETRSLLMFDAGNQQRMALPLESVERLEEFRRERVERAGDAQVIQYGRQILRLLHLQEVFGQPAPVAGPETFQVVVHSRDGESLGLVVDRIADIVEERVRIDASMRRHGVLGATVLQGSVTEVLDIDAAWRLLDARQQQEETR